MEEEKFECFADTFKLSLSPWGANLTFGLSAAGSIVEPETQKRPVDLGTIWMSNELLKLMVFALRNYLIQHESQNMMQYNVPSWVFSQMGIDPAEWHLFWQGERG